MPDDKPKEMQTYSFMGFNQAKGWVEMNQEKGCICPCCKQLVKRKINIVPKLDLK